jgi:nucleotide-binding universal stress UspA family protein
LKSARGVATVVMYRNVLVPTDGSEAADRALARGIDLARAFDGSVHVLYVVEPLQTAEYDAGAIYDALRTEGERATEAAAERVREAGLPVETAVEVGVPHTTILEYADAHGADLVVMGTHGRTGLDRYLLGSVTEKVVRLSDVPVLTVRTAREK